MPTYLVESFLSRSGPGLEETIASVQRAAQSLAAAGGAIRYVRTTFLAEEETCFHLFEGPSARVVGEAAERAGLFAASVVEVVERTSPVSG
jgi:hypothetical protein